MALWTRSNLRVLPAILAALLLAIFPGPVRAAGFGSDPASAWFCGQLASLPAADRAALSQLAELAGEPQDPDQSGAAAGDCTVCAGSHHAGWVLPERIAEPNVWSRSRVAAPVEAAAATSSRIRGPPCGLRAPPAFT